MKKKNYIVPTTKVFHLNTKKTLLVSISNTEAAAGSEGNGVNMGRESSGDFWDDAE